MIFFLIIYLVLWTVHICQVRSTGVTDHFPMGFLQGFNDGLPALSQLDPTNFHLDFNSQPHHIQDSINDLALQDEF